MSERHNVIDMFSRRPLVSAENRAHLIQRLVDLDNKIEPLEREAELIRRTLGFLAVERGCDE